MNRYTATWNLFLIDLSRSQDFSTFVSVRGSELHSRGSSPGQGHFVVLKKDTLSLPGCING